MPVELTIIGDREFFASFGKGRRHPMLLLADALDDIRGQMEHGMRVTAPKGKTGSLALEGIGSERVVPISSNVVRGVVGLRKSPEHGIWVHEGTGIFGQYRRPIFSPRGNIMKFKTDDGRWISKRLIRGQTPQPFVRDVYLALSRTYVPLRIRKLAVDLSRR